MHEDESERFRVAYVHNYPEERVGILIPDSDDTHGGGLAGADWKARVRQ